MRYAARVAWPNLSVTDETLVATATGAGGSASGIPVDLAGDTVGVWRWPDDPFLPGLLRATDPSYVRALLDDAGGPPGPLTLSTRAYWPGRRAVIEVAIPSQKLRFDPASGGIGRSAPARLAFVKVVRPSEATALQDLHEALAPLPVARSLARDPELGILVLEALPGQTISRCLADPASRPPPPAELVDLLLRLGKVALAGEPRRTTAGKIANHVRLLKALLPDEAAALDRFVELYGDEVPQPLTTVHGDFHEEQVLAVGGRVSGLLDVDDAGPGQLVDDLALMIARVRSRAAFSTRGGDSARAYAQELLEVFGRQVDSDELGRRAAGAMLGRATAPFRAQVQSWPAKSRERIRAAETALELWARTRARA